VIAGAPLLSLGERSPCPKGPILEPAYQCPVGMCVEPLISHVTILKVLFLDGMSSTSATPIVRQSNMRPTSPPYQILEESM
jgi:hypothetical protein